MTARRGGELAALGVAVTRPATSARHTLRAGRGDVIEIVGPAQGSRLDVHLNAIRAAAGPGPYHLHTTAANFYFVLDGTVRLRIAGIDHLIGPGDAVSIGPGVPHSVSVEGDGAARLIEVYAPAAPDFVDVHEPSGEYE